MRKKTASRTRKHPEVTGNQTSGLIAKGKEPRQSVGEKSVLDNRSHRTPVSSTGLRSAFAGELIGLSGELWPGPPGSRRAACSGLRGTHGCPAPILNRRVRYLTCRRS